ncbi:ABC transporter permease [Martelella alba]|uniref:ABC transporter permease n=1 Tax=Martelella alba TaxID=2590451 RepID=A0A506U473_9HYPH|nr:ABC transporter permease [Martelella alba]TPW29183.1 ABC transporter permease [Martelella alba]
MATRLLKSREALLVLAMVILATLIELRFSGFLSAKNIVSIFNDTAILIILALGQAAVILARGIDLSIAANLALSGTVAALVNASFPGVPVEFLLVLSVLVGALLGAINGLLVWKLDIPPIVVTLGTMTVYRGMIFLLTDGAWINAHEMSDAFKAVPRAVIFGLPLLSWIALCVIAVMILVFSFTRIGRAFYAVGGNPNAAVYTGISVGRTHFFAYVVAGTLAGLAGYLWVARYAVAYVDIANGFELDVVAACVIGGISIAGGVGTAIGAVLGALFLGIIKNALPVIDISPFWQMAISGTVIIIAVAVNARAARPKGRVILKKAEHAI